jgi:surface antigen
MTVEFFRFGASRFRRPVTCFAVLMVVSGCETLQTSSPAADHLALDSALQDALENNASGESESWQNPDTGDAGSVRPIRTFVSASGLPCREYDVAAAQGEGSQSYRDVACRDVDGVWKDGG